jgi:hypothetical protein
MLVLLTLLEKLRLIPRCHFLSQKGEFHKLADAKIFLSDCLACDSCVTSDEGAQLSQRSTKVFFRVLNLNKVQHPGIFMASLATPGVGLGLRRHWNRWPQHCLLPCVSLVLWGHDCTRPVFS